ncbi:hypothetical protein [Sinobaca sp. H24]|uniref:hypothetical protein n=1 Tax=Sinobaca sp. H24 TaxID=2923376 RepID=UPI00207B04BB|nr:hypothetical protein [Sinobaca sp. H24]
MKQYNEEVLKERGFVFDEEATKEETKNKFNSNGYKIYTQWLKDERIASLGVNNDTEDKHIISSLNKLEEDRKKNAN